MDTEEKNVGLTQALPGLALVTIPDTVTETIDGEEVTRHRKYAAYLSLGIQQSFDQIPDPIILNANIPTIVIDSDSLDSIEEELIKQVKQVFQNAKDVTSGKITQEDIARGIAYEQVRLNKLLDEEEAKEATE